MAGSAGSGYTVRAWAKYDSGGGVAEIKVEFHDGSEVKIVEEKRYIYPSSVWTEYAIAGVAPPGTAYVTATVVGLGGSTVLFDGRVTGG